MISTEKRYQESKAEKKRKDWTDVSSDSNTEGD